MGAQSSYGVHLPTLLCALRGVINVPDFRHVQLRAKAVKAVNSMIDEDGVTGSAIRIMLMENYGLSSNWLNTYIRDLEREGIVEAVFIGGRIETVKRAVNDNYPNGGKQ